MSYLNFDKTVLVNLERSLQKEMIRTNRAGVYNSTTLVDCNTRKYHGQLVMPLPHISDENFVLLSSLDETVIQHGAEFNLGLHEYGENHFSPNGHKYIREFDCDVISRTTYRVGAMVLQKERMLVSFEPRVHSLHAFGERQSDDASFPPVPGFPLGERVDARESAGQCRHERLRERSIQPHVSGIPESVHAVQQGGGVSP